MEKGKAKIAKGATERMYRDFCAARGYTFLYVNWKKRKAHFLSPSGVKMTEFVRQTL